MCTYVVIRDCTGNFYVVDLLFVITWHDIIMFMKWLNLVYNDVYAKILSIFIFGYKI